MIGRGPLTRVKDSRVSRRQLRLELITDTSPPRVTVQQLGHNSSVVRGEVMVKGQETDIGEGDTLELVRGQYIFLLVRGKDPRQGVVDEADTKPVTANRTGHWSSGLLGAMSDPNLMVRGTKSVVVIRDKYPKAKYHYLVLPRARVTGLSSLTIEHLELLREIEEEGRRVACSHSGVKFKLGYHAVPSMSQLHLHVISDDLDSVCLKHKVHWNSFTQQDYFLSPQEVERELQEEGGITDKKHLKQLLNSPLQCHKCDYKPKNIPDLKMHIKNHQK